MSKVFVIQEANGKNILPAREYGELSIVFPSLYQVYHDADEALQILKAKLADYSESDSLLLIGDPVLISLASMVASERTGGRLKLLKWDRQEKQYVQIKITLDNKC